MKKFGLSFKGRDAPDGTSPSSRSPSPSVAFSEGGVFGLAKSRLGHPDLIGIKRKTQKILKNFYNLNGRTGCTQPESLQIVQCGH